MEGEAGDLLSFKRLYIRVGLISIEMVGFLSKKLYLPVFWVEKLKGG